MAPMRPKTSPSLVDDRRSEGDGEGRGGAKYNTHNIGIGDKQKACVMCVKFRKER